MIVVEEKSNLEPLQYFSSSNHMIDLPFKSCKDITSNGSTTRTPIAPTASTTSNVCQEHSQGDESCKPEEHGNSFGGEDSKLMGSRRIASWGENQVDQS